MSQVRAIRGATQLEANTAEAMEAATKELLLEILAANALCRFFALLKSMCPELSPVSYA